MEYIDYQIFIGSNLEIVASSHGTSETGELRLDTKEIEYSVGQLENEKSHIDRRFIKNVGKQLADSLFTPEIKKHFYEVKSKNANKGLRVRLRIESPEITAYPWEALFLNNKYIAASTATPLTRYLTNGIPAKMSFGRPLKILVIGSNPSRLGLPAVQVEREIEAIEDSLGEEIDDGAIKLVPERIGDVERIMNHLNNEQYNVIHFIGHGVFEDDVGYLALESGEGALLLYDHEKIGQLFQNQNSLGLVVLNACQGAMLSTNKAFTGLASELLKMGVPSVIAMRYSITNQTAKLFSKEFYKNLPRMPIDENVQMVRHRILVDPDTTPKDFITPVLFMSASDGMIFSPKDDAARDIAQSPACTIRIEELKRDWDELVGGSDAVDEMDFWLKIWDLYKSCKDLLPKRPKREIREIIPIVPVLLTEMNKAVRSGLEQDVIKFRRTIRLNYQNFMDRLE